MTFFTTIRLPCPKNKKSDDEKLILWHFVHLMNRMQMIEMTALLEKHLKFKINFKIKTVVTELPR